mmetsp:Transcript_30507/g.55305  ORF Transcript_30507/g.55305 Transcript_30507/m.55305 type:complete len:108 (-) Transcript_30507:110-433(-)
MAAFVKQTSKLPCNPDTEENCDKKDKKYLEEIKELSLDKQKEALEQFEKDLNTLTKDHKNLTGLFETQKEEAMATMKKQEELKKSLSKLKSKNSHKLQILKAKTAEL